MILNLSRPKRIIDEFIIPADNTPWNPTCYDVSYQKCIEGWTPIRNRASFTNIKHAAIAQNENLWNAMYGIYFIFSTVPSPVAYVGIASQDAKSPEGIYSRLRKHRIKLTGSHVGQNNTHGGVHHPRKWGTYAIQRHLWHVTNGNEDQLDDITILTAEVEDISIQRKEDLERFEKHLFNNCSGCIDLLFDKIAPKINGDYTLLNTITKCTHKLPGDALRLWDGSIIKLH